MYMCYELKDRSFYDVEMSCAYWVRDASKGIEGNFHSSGNMGLYFLLKTIELYIFLLKIYIYI